MPAQAYFDEAWFRLEQELVIDTTWHRGESGNRVESWQGMDFCSSRPAQDLETALAGLPEAIGSFEPSRLVEIARVDIEGEFNWKLFIENHIDVLHLWYLHDKTLAPFDHTEFEHQSIERNWVSWEPARPGEFTPLGSPISHLAERDRSGLAAHLLFPDTPFAASASFFASYRARALGPDRTVVELRVFAEPGADPEPICAGLRAFIEEDIAACERIQQAVRSRHFEVGPLAVDHEAPLVRFQNDLLELMNAAP